MIKVLFICHGNICRSAMAEIMLQYMVNARGLQGMFEIDSAATSREEIGNTMYPPAVRELARHGMQPNGHRARQMTREDYERFDYILGMDYENLRNMQRMWPEDNGRKIHLILDYTSRPGAVADPWYTDNFTKTYADLEEGLNGFLLAILGEKGETQHERNR